MPTTSDDVTISGTVTTTLSSGQTANFNSLTIGDGTNATALILTGNIGTGGSITLANRGTLIQNNTTQQIITGTLTIQSGGVLKHSANSTAQSYVVNLKAATIDLQSGGAVNVDGLGYAAGTAGSGGYGPGGGGYIKASRAGGGGHGGNGAHGGTGATSESGGGIDGDGGVAYCDVTDVATIGSGGGATASVTGTGNGGGLVILEATGTATISGTLSAKGLAAGSATIGGGAGGGIKLTANTIEGTPTAINISGGAGGSHPSGGGGGGGGCMLVTYTTSNTITNDMVTMNGGTATNNIGGAGVLYIKQTGANGTLASVNSAFASASTTQVASSITLAALTVTKANYYVGSGKTLILTPTSTDALGGGGGQGQINVHGTLTLNGSDINAAKVILANGSTFNNSATLNILNSGALTLLSGATLGTTVGTLTTTGTLALDSGATFTVDNLSIAGNTTTLNNYSLTTPLNLNGSLSMTGGSMTHATNTTAQTHILFVSSTSITIGAGARINVTGMGYRNSGSGPGPGVVQVGSGGGGGAHGGNGGTKSLGTGGTAYCTVTNIETMGSPGGKVSNATDKSSGGGLIYLKSAATTTVNGHLQANGQEGLSGATSVWGGGGGGGIRISARAITGTPVSIVADGGAAAGNSAGGGGGCIQVTYHTSNTITATSTSITVNGASGGTTAAGNGLFLASQSNALPTTTAFSVEPSQISTSTVTFTTVVSDGDADISHLMFDYSLDGNVWSSSTRFTATASQGTLTTSTGVIAGIFSTTTVTISWDVAGALPNTDTATAYIRLTARDGISTNTPYRTSSAFTIDTTAPTAPDNVSAVTTTVSAITFGFPTAALSTDTNFKEYKIWYSSSTPVGETRSAFTSSSDSNLGSRTFNGEDTSVALAGLSASTRYHFNLFAYDQIGNIVSSTAESSTTTLASTPSSLSASSGAGNTVMLSWSGDGTEYSIEATKLTNPNHWITAKTYTFTDASCGTTYRFRVKARNGAKVETSFSDWLSFTACPRILSSKDTGGGSGPSSGRGSSGPSGRGGSAPSDGNQSQSPQSQSKSESPTQSQSPSRGDGPAKSGSESAPPGAPGVSPGSESGSPGAQANSPSAESSSSETKSTKSGEVSRARATLPSVFIFSQPSLTPPTQLTKPSFLSSEAIARTGELAPNSPTKAATPGEAQETLTQNQTVAETPAEVTAQAEAIVQAIAAAAQSIAPSIGESQSFAVSGESHEVSVSAATSDRVTFTLRSEPVTLNLAKGESQEVDTDGDGIADTLVAYQGLFEDKPLLTFAPLTDAEEKQAPLTINAGALQTSTTSVLLMLNAPTNTLQIEIANTPEFTDAVSTSVTSTFAWSIPNGSSGVRTVYARFTTASGTVTAEDTIFLAIESLTTELTAPTTTEKIFTRYLVWGSMGLEIRKLQTLLRLMKFFTFHTSTGFYGPITTAAIKSFQIAHDLPPVGVVGPKTRAILNSLVGEYGL